MIPGMGVHKYKGGGGGCFTDSISFILIIP